MSVPLTVLDLVPVSSGSTAAEALGNSVDLAQRSEDWGYARYWVAEHHLNPGVAGTSPAVVLALIGAATRHIRLGSAAVQMGHRTALSTVEEFGLLDAAFPGRVDLGLGRSGGKPPGQSASSQPGATSATALARTETVVERGIVLPPPFDPRPLLNSPRVGLARGLLSLPGAQPQDYADQIADVVSLIAGTYSAEGEQAHVIPGEHADLQIWILGSSGGESAQIAGSRGLRFGANYHVSPATVLEAVDAYRAEFRPSPDLAAPYVSVSADVVVAETADAACELAHGYSSWVRSIRTASGAIAYPTPDEARGLGTETDDDPLVADRVATRFVGTAGEVADSLDALRAATDADELIVTTITHDHKDRLRSYELLAQEWARR